MLVVLQSDVLTHNVTQEIVTVRNSVLSAPHGSIATERTAIISALDLLFTGF
ncbi:MAG TPA: hypothetical protein VLX44_15205 [Xanthobacteraceae bacterium]|nr:hypothetical protein [Xanthobacteraceae bacterium]